MHKLRTRGFTLIELLVVIAIIGILSAVILASLSTARQKGTDAATQSDLASIQTQAEIDYGSLFNNAYGSNSSGIGTIAPGYGVACTPTTFTGTIFGNDSVIESAVAAIANNSGATPYCSVLSGGTAYAINAVSKTGASAYVYCVDSHGFSGTTTTTAYSPANAECTSSD